MRCSHASNLVLGDNLKINPIAEHKDKSYIIHFMNIPPELLYYSFNKRWQLEEFIYRNGIEQFKYKSSNGKTINKVWEYIPEKLEEWKKYNIPKKKPEKYSWDDYMCGHFIKSKSDNID